MYFNSRICVSICISYTVPSDLLTSLNCKYIHYKQVQQSDYFITSSILAITKNLHMEAHIIYLKYFLFISPLYLGHCTDFYYESKYNICKFHFGLVNEALQIICYKRGY
jgi:hypothetical protein